MRNESLSTKRMYIRAHLHQLSLYRKYATILLKKRLKRFLQERRREAPEVVERARSLQITTYSYDTFVRLKLHAKVKSSDGKRYYSVHIDYDPSLDSLFPTCTCQPGGLRSECEHVVALAQAFIRSGRPPKPELPVVVHEEEP